MCDFLSLFVPLLKDLSLVAFAGIGLFFTYRAWRQREDEIHEKYFDRRVELFEMVNGALHQGMIRSDNFEGWWHQLDSSRYRTEFLFGGSVRKLHEQAFSAIIEYQDAMTIDDDTQRVALAKAARTNLETVSSELRERMMDKIRLKRWLT